MTARTRCLFDDDDEPEDTRDAGELLLEMDSVMRIKTNKAGLWHARARGAQDFAAGDTPLEAMRAAVKLPRRAR